MVKISIIVPIYNVEKYLEKCLDSLLNQDLSPNDYEIICVNDGSPDNSGQIVSNYTSQYSNIISLHQENQGVSVARNKGLELAKGEYILFVDGDDSLYPNVLETLYSNAQTKVLDLLYLQIDYFNENEVFTGSFQMDSDNGEILDGFHHQRRGYICGLYRKELIRTIRFEEDIPIAEDALFNIMVHSIAQRCSYLPVPAYRYLIRAGSALNSKVCGSEKTFLGYLKFMDFLANYINQKQETYTSKQLDYFNRPFFKIIEMSLLTNIIPTLSISRYSRLRKKMKENRLTHLNETIKKSVPFFGKPWLLFFSYYGLRKIYTKLKFE